MGVLDPTTETVTATVTDKAFSEGEKVIVVVNDVKTNAVTKTGKPYEQLTCKVDSANKQGSTVYVKFWTQKQKLAQLYNVYGKETVNAAIKDKTLDNLTMGLCKRKLGIVANAANLSDDGSMVFQNFFIVKNLGLVEPPAVEIGGLGAAVNNPGSGIAATASVTGATNGAGTTTDLW